MSKERNKGHGFLTTRYLLALLAPAVVTGAMQVTWPFFQHSPVLPYLLAVIFCAWYGGLGPGLLSLVLSLLLTGFFFIEPYFFWGFPKQHDLIKLLFFAVVGSSISVMSKLMHKQRRRAGINLNALRASEERYRQMAENFPNGAVITYDRDFRVTFIAGRGLQEAGYSPDFFVGRLLSEIVPPEVVTVVDPHFRAAFSGKIETYECPFLDGKTYFAAVAPLDSENGLINEILVISQDITERKQAEESLREAERKYRSIFENAVEGIFQTTPSGRFIAANPALARMLGFDSPEELIRARTNIAHDHYVNPQSREEFKQSMEENGFVFNFELEAYRKDRSRIWISENVRAVRDEYGSIIYYEGTAEDMTDRKRAETRSTAFANLAHKLSGAWTALNAGQIIAETADDLFGWDACTLDLYDAEHDVIHPMLNMDMIGGQRVSVTPLVSGQSPTPKGRRVIDHGPELILRDEPLKFDGDAVPIGDLSRPSAALMAAPIRHASRVIGILSFQSYTPRAYDDVAFSDLQALSDHCGEALNRLQAENQLLESEERYRDLVENSHDLICTHDLDGLILSANRAALEAMGYPSASYAASKNLREILPLESREQFNDYLQTIRADGVASGVVTVQTENGEQRIWEYQNTLRTQGVATPVVRGMARDITEQRRVEEALRESESFRRMIIEAEPECVKVVAPNYVLLDMNPAGLKMIEATSREQVIGQSVLSLVAPECRSIFMEMHERVCQGESVVTEFEIVGLKGTRRWMESHAAPLLDKESNVIAQLAITRDVTERKRAQEALTIFRNLIDQSSDAIEVLEPNTLRFLDCNATAHQVLGYTREDFLALTAFDIDPVIDQAMLSRLDEVMEKSGFVIFESVHRRKDGSTFPVEINTKNIRLERNYRLSVVRDITDRKRAEAALRDAERKYRDIFENAGEGIFQSTPNGRFLAANPALAHMHGFASPEELIHSSPDISRQRYVDPGRREDFKRLLEEQGAVRDFEYQVFRKDRSKIWISVNARAVRDEEGEIQYYEGTAQDITDRKRAEEALRESEERLRLALDAAHMGTFDWDVSRNRITWSPWHEELWGFKPGEFGGTYETFSERVHHDDLREINAEVARCIAAREPFSREFRVVWPDESVHWMQARGEFAFGDDGQPVRMRGAVVETTERKRAEEARRESEERYRDLIENSRELICTHDLDGLVLSANPAAVAAVGYDVDEYVGKKTIRDLLAPEVNHQFDQYMARLRKEGTTSGIMLVQTKSGERRVWEYYNSLRTEGVAAPIVRGMARDITDRMRAEAMLASEKRILEMIATGASLPDLLETLAREIESQSKSLSCSILLLDADGVHLRHGAAPSLPDAYCRAIDGVSIGPSVGFCGTAAFRKELVVVEDIATDPLWEDYRELAREHGLRACWSTPILTADGNVMGTFAMYYRESRRPGPTDLELIERATQMAAIAIERRQAEQALSESERRHRDIFTFAPVGIYQSLRDGTLITANKALAEMLGYASVDELLRVKLGSGVYFAEDEREKLIREYEGLGYAVDLDMQWKRKDGSPICVQLSAQAIKGPNGETEYFEGFVRDITERKRAEESLRKQNEYLAALHETALGLINRLDLDELLEDIVTRACALVDIPGGYVYLIEPGGTGMRVKVGVGVSRDFVGALIRKGEGLAGRIWQTGKPLVVDDYRNWEHRLTDAGYDVLLTVGAVPLRSGSQVVGVLGVESTEDGQGLGEHQIEILNRFAQLASIALDNAQLHSAVQQELAERKRAGEELRASEERYRELFEQASDVIFKTDARGNWGSFNPAAVKLLKYGEKELTGKYYLDLVKPEYRSAVKGFYQEQFRTKTPNTRYEFPAIAKDGTEVWIEQRATLLFENDQAAGLHLVARDITERKRAEAALRESEERYRDLVENSREFICTHDLNGLILSANRAASEVLGYDLNGYRGKKNFRDLLAPEVRDQFDDYLTRLRRDGFASGLTLVQTSSGERRILEYHNTLRTEGVATPIVRGMGRDITEQRRAEKAMSVLRRELELTMNSMEEGVHRVDLKGNIVFENPAAARMLGWEVAELLGKPGHLTMHHTRPDGTPYPKEECPIYATFRDGVSRQVADEVFYRQDGTSFPVEYQTAPMRNDRNEITATVVTFRDITERKRAEGDLRESEERYRELFENSKDAIYVHDLNGRYTSLNRAAEKLSGYSREEILGSHFSNFVAPGDLKDVRENLCKKLDEMGETFYEIDLITKDRRRVPVEVISRLIYENGVPIGVQGIARDITERKHAREALQTYSRRLIEAQEAERQHIARELHDQIGQVLTAIRINLQTVGNSCETEESSSLVDQGVGLVDAAIDQVRNLSFELRPSLLDNLGLAAALRWYSDQYTQRTGIRTKSASNLPEGKIRLRQELETACFRIVQEALTNVVRHANAKNVFIDLKQVDHKIVLSIKDDGIGFNEATNGDVSATRLGLRGMKERALALGGELKIKSGPALGTEIRATFPTGGKED